MSTDTRELRAFQEKIDKLAKGSGGMSDFYGWALRKMGGEFLSRVIKRTPAEENETFQYRTIGRRINTKVIRGGALRRGWTGDVEVSPTGESHYLESKPVKHAGNAYELDITNSKKYASFVEYGHSQTPGRFVPYIGELDKDGVKTGAVLTRSRVPGQYMMERTVVEMESMKTGLADRLTQEYFSKYF